MRRSPSEVPCNPAESVVDLPEAPIGSALLRLVRAHFQLGASLLAEIGLVPPQELVLLRLDEHENGTLPQSEIVRFLNRDRSTVTATLQSMERAGLVTRTPSQTDGRALDTAITDAGRALCPEIRRRWTELEEASFGHLDADVRSALITALSTARDRLVGLSRSRAGVKVG